jgi:replicative DNA helicase
MEFIPTKTLSELTREFKYRLYTIAKSNNGITGIPSGFEKLDAITKGFQPSNLILIGGVAGMGKTSFALSLIHKMAIENQCPTAFFSLEMTNQQLMMSIIRQQTNISLDNKFLEALLKRADLTSSSVFIIAFCPFIIEKTFVASFESIIIKNNFTFSKTNFLNSSLL